MGKSTEVIIIGAGVIGCSIAYHLAKMGCHDVIVLEKSYIGSGSTEKCAGGIRQQFATEVNIKLSMESVKFFERFEEETGYTADFRQYGYLMLATTADEVKQFKGNVALQQKLRVDVRLISPQDARKILPQLNVKDVLSATFCPTDGYADPYSVVHGFARAAKSLGVKILEGTPITDIILERDKVTGVVTPGGRYYAPVVVNATGPWAKEIGRMLGIDIPVAAHKRHIFVTEPVKELQKNLPMIIEFKNGFWFRREGKCLVFGMRNPDETESYDISIDWEFFSAHLAVVASNRLPLLNNVGIMRAQAGLHEDTPDANAILSTVPEVEGLYLACGFSGHGFMHSPAVGRIMAELILGKGSALPGISPLSLQRFGQSARHAENVFI
ncbi:MAG: FAD-binding oxidoreductase [Dehalococcoidia bacterium]|nr:FAD-binding oxidoreductase [Dehalococcoidia bacterium]